MAQSFRRSTLVSLLAAVLLLATGCAVTPLVQPYDEKLLNDTEVIFKKASAMIDDGISKSPKSDAERTKIKERAAAKISPIPLADHPAHVTKFESQYNELAIDVDALILRALAKSQDISPLGNKLQKGIENLIDKNLPSACTELEQEFSALTSNLTVKNFVDLKCILVRWKDQHENDTLTDGTGILKRTNWELRRSAIFLATLTIVQAESSKKKK